MKTAMKRILLLFALIALVVMPSFSQEQSQKKVAVYITGDDVDSSVKKVIGAKLVAAITSSSGYAAVERTADFLNALSKEQDYQSSGEVRDSQIAKLGQRFGVKYVVVADVTEVFDEYYIQARLINVETGLVVNTADVSGPAESASQVISLAQRLSDSLMKGMSGGSSSTTFNGHEAVDLGLSVKWATCNVGAARPEQYGNYYAWGETSTKGSYLNENCRTLGVSLGSISGRREYDVARATWGGTWRMPTRAEMQELVDLCSWQWTTMGGQEGMKVTGPNGNSIFLPAAGFRDWSGYVKEGSQGNYWTSTPAKSDYDGQDDNHLAYAIEFNNYFNVFSVWRYFGFSVRPVSD
ncbi:MAG: hypothetical protein J1E63_04365 [Muribaculaceae bacterium]|nr:hypothetical protein [Muribaculaceae bacterium]